MLQTNPKAAVKLLRQTSHLLGTALKTQYYQGRGHGSQELREDQSRSFLQWTRGLLW